MIGDIQDLDADALKDNAAIFDLIQDTCDKLKVPLEFGYYVALCGLFPPSRNIIKNWESNEEVFLSLVKEEGKIG
jgi:hypothetical protein